mgnify:CR=1 FL=1
MSYYHSTVIGIQDGFEGLVEGSMRELSWLDVSGIIGLGGTILGTSNKGDPFHFPMGERNNVRIVDASGKDVQRAAQRLLSETARSVSWYVPEGEGR